MFDAFGLYKKKRQLIFARSLASRKIDFLGFIHYTRGMRKICYVANTDMAIRFILFNHLKFLKKKGYDVCAVCSKGDLIKEVREKGIKVKIINFNRGLNPFAHLVSLFRLISFFRKEKFDIIHTHNPVPCLLGQLAAKIVGIPCIISTIHGLYFQGAGGIKRKFFIFIEKISARCSDRIFSVSNGIIDVMIKENICSLDKIKYLGNGINIERFNSKRFSKEFIDKKKKELGISGFKVIGIIGRLVKEKGYLELFEAVKDLPETKLLVIGPEEPKKKDRLDINNRKNVLFLGQRTDVDELYPLFDIFVLPSYREGLPYSIIEASSSSVPVVASDIPACLEAVDNGVTGILVPVKDVVKLKEALTFLLNNPEKAKLMGRNGRRKVGKEFDEKIIFNKLIKEYDQICQ